MAEHGFTTTFTVDQTPAETDWAGEEFDYHYEDVHRCRIRVTEAVPGRQVSWLVLDNYFNFIQDQTEWKGTTITFEIAGRDGQTEVRFTHHGLVTAYECFDVCSNAWGFYINGSLRSLITTGVGQPNRSGRPNLAAEAAAGQAGAR